MHIYKFTHIESNRCYIGQTIQDPNQRRLEHIADSRYTTRVYHFHNAIRKYGIDAFTFEVIAEANSLEELNMLEEKYVEQFDSINNGSLVCVSPNVLVVIRTLSSNLIQFFPSYLNNLLGR